MVARVTALKEDASLAAFYLLSLALGVTIISLRGTNVDLLHVLFGNVLALDDQTLLLIATVASVTLSCWRCSTARWRSNASTRLPAPVSRAGGPAQFAFLGLVVLNLVAASTRWARCSRWAS